MFFFNREQKYAYFMTHKSEILLNNQHFHFIKSGLLYLHRKLNFQIGISPDFNTEYRIFYTDISSSGFFFQ